MSDRSRYTEHRPPRSSLAGHIGRSTATDAEIRALAAEALKAGVILFLRKDLEELPWASREIITAEAERLYGQRR